MTENSVCTASPQLLWSLAIFTTKHYFSAWGLVWEALHSVFWVTITSYPGGFPAFPLRSFPAPISYSILETLYQSTFFSLGGPSLYSLDGIFPGNLTLQERQARTALCHPSGIQKTLPCWFLHPWSWSACQPVPSSAPSLSYTTAFHAASLLN